MLYGIGSTLFKAGQAVILEADTDKPLGICLVWIQLIPLNNEHRLVQIIIRLSPQSAATRVCPSNDTSSIRKMRGGSYHLKSGFVLVMTHCLPVCYYKREILIMQVALRKPPFSYGLQSDMQPCLAGLWKQVIFLAIGFNPRAQYTQFRGLWIPSALTSQ